MMQRGKLSSSVEHLWLAALSEPEMMALSPEVEQSKLFEEVSAEATRGDQPRQSGDQATLFTSSGNHFVFDELRQREERRVSELLSSRSVGNFATAYGDVIDAGTEGQVKTPAPQAARSNVVESVTAALTLQQLDAYQPQDEEQARLAARFIDLFRRPNKALSSAVKQLEDMLRYYTELMYVEVAEGARNGLELCCARDTLMHKVKDDPRFPNLVFTSFERGLKHAGLYVTQSTHGKVPIKRWGFKELGKQGVKKKKSTERKRARSDQEQGGGSAGDDGPRKRDNSAELTSSDADEGDAGSGGKYSALVTEVSLKKARAATLMDSLSSLANASALSSPSHDTKMAPTSAAQ